MRIAASALRDLKNERRLGIDAAPKKAKDLLQIVDVIPAKRILGVSKSIKSSSRDNHSREYRRDLRQSARGFSSAQLGAWRTQAVKQGLKSVAVRIELAFSQASDRGNE